MWVYRPPTINGGKILHHGQMPLALKTGRHTQAGDATDQWRDQWNVATDTW